ncbi:MAG TPA: XrtA/PEP-CTERM system amidotransferase [Casimicrobiaceae bacterium]|nr:XrtA/PEP-CTERM system amidotransferase [Casimicrobiaceae bacterium]
MCGIVGIFDISGRRPIARELVGRMNASLSHRGPDADGFHFEPGVALGHRRLSIIDLSTGDQPLYNEDGSVVVMFNGEIYNYRELIPELASHGHAFRTKSDTEVIVHAWEQWGEDCVSRFRGMFAFALWDRNRETLFLARDRLGVKPMYYARLGDGTLAFGSELKALMVHPGFRREIEPRAVEDYLAYGYVPEPHTIFAGALKLPPGCTLAVRRGDTAAQPREYWDIPFQPRSGLSPDEAREELIPRLRDAVESRMIADVPLGAFLSGGVDSSAVVAMMAGASKEPVNTCSISFGDPAFNESAYAQAVADRYRTNHRIEQVDPDDFGLLDALADVYDEPFADSSAIPTYRLCQLARKSVKVALSGDGGDENFAGYRRYRWHVYEERMRSMLPHSVRAPVFGLLGNLYPKADWAPKVLRAKSTLEALARNSIEGYFHSVSVMGDPLRDRLLSDAFRRELQGYRAVEVLRRHAARAPRDEPLSFVQYLDMKTYLVGDILTKVDRASMAHSLEVREPLLDHRLMEWLSGLAPALKLRGREGKFLFKKALEPYLPNDVLYRPKMGFSVPLASWFRGPLKDRVQQAVLGPVLADSGYFNPRFLREMVDQHRSGARDYSVALWSLLMFEAFLRKAMGAGDTGQAKAA